VPPTVPQTEYAVFPMHVRTSKRQHVELVMQPLAPAAMHAAFAAEAVYVPSGLQS
jgi:hypothetical protein